ncbi:MAG TPA: efflux RND transporter periplasmic adaptor subunit [Kofleriaceae bacterium]|nr:efflux RND transporter periplasmic adaptor subunit [Kofleriaceae bacterium]
MVRSTPGVLSAALAAIALAGACKEQPPAPAAPPPRAIEVLTLAPTELRETGEYLGALLSRDSVTVLSQVTGYVRAIRVKPGTRVAAGDPLIEVDAREEGAQLASARAQAESAAAALALARQSRKRAEALFGQGLVSAQEVDERRADVAAAEAAARAAGAQVSQRRVVMQYNVVKAAVPGVVGDVQVRIGDYVNPTTRLTTIAGKGGLELTIGVPAERARGLKVGAPIELLASDGKVLLTSAVFYVAAEADPRTQLVEVKAALDNTIGLRPSEIVRARLVYSSRRALQIPATAVVRQSGQAFAYAVVEKGGGLVIERRPVVLGALGERNYVIDKGLAEGDRVAVSSLQQLRDGAPVTIKQAAAAATPPAGGGP